MIQPLRPRTDPRTDPRPNLRAAHRSALRVVHLPVLSMLLLLPGCGSLTRDHTQPFISADDPRLRQIDPTTPDKLPMRAEPDDENDDPAALRAVPYRATPVDRMELDIENVRAAALEHNLDLQVRLFDPAIARTSVDEEEARFEAVLGAGIRHANIDSPVALGTEGSRNERTDADVDLSVPLRTGGRLQVRLPVSRTSTNNPFALLDPAYTTSLRAVITHPLLRGAGTAVTTHGIRIARHQETIATARTRLEIIAVLAAADRAYWRLHEAQQDLEVAIRQYELAQTQLERARRRVQAGESPEIEMLRAESGVASRVESIIIAENLRRSRQRELKRLMNMPEVPMESAVELVVRTQPTPIRITPDEEAVVRLALANRMELLELELHLALDAAQIDVARNQRLPRLDAEAGYGLSGLGGSVSDAWRPVPRRQFDDWSVGLRAEIPIGNEAAEARLRSAKLSRLQRLSSREARTQLVRQEVHDAIDRVRLSWQRIVAARRESELAQRTLEAEQRQFDVGLRTSTDVLDAATRLAEAQQREISALVDHELSQIDLAVSTGTLLGRSRITWQPAGLD